MQKVGFNKDWRFMLQSSDDPFNTFGFDKYSDAAGAAGRYYDHCNWERVELPHDWSLSLGKHPLANTFAGAYPNTRYHRFMTERRSEVETVYNIGWYRKQFTVDPAWQGKHIFIEFEGVFRDAIVWVNGVYLDRHNSGYTSFLIEITDHLTFDEENTVAVRVDSEQNEGWWYEGAGIYRNVNLFIGEPMYFKYNQTVIKTQLNGLVDASAVLVNDTPNSVEKNVAWCICEADGKAVAKAACSVEIAPYSQAQIRTQMTVEHPRLWSVDSPYLYSLTLCADGEQATERFGIRTVAFDADRGFILNGVPLKLHGACVHQDFGGVGVALTDNLQRYKIQRLKDMGVNAYRCAHHAPAPALLKACDELGMLVMDETRMFGTSPEAVRQLTDLIERDRNHPCVFIWSLGNEEFSVQNVAWGYRLMEKATRIAKTLDPTRPITYGGCNGDNFVGANGAAEVRGINYIRNGKPEDWIDTYHKAHPNQPIVGSEESSYVISRGGAVTDLESGRLDSTGNVTMPWGSTPKGWVKFTEERDYFAGGFMWTGFDYRGEPNPFYYKNSVSSFGTIDLCGMEKPPFYYYKAWWTNQPVLKLTPHWNHSVGDIVTVAVFTNCEEITLSLNGKVLETRRVEQFGAPQFKVPYQPGVLCVTGTRNGQVLTDELVTAGEPAEVRCTLALEAKGSDEVGIYELNAYDAKGVHCPLAANPVEISVSGGELIGVGNGDPASMDYERKPMQEQAIYLSSLTVGEKQVPIPQKQGNVLPYREEWLEPEPKGEVYRDDFRLVVKSRIAAPQDQKKEYTAQVCDVEGYEYIEFERLGGRVQVYLNGCLLGNNHRWHGRHDRTYIRPYRFYGKFKKGQNQIKLVCEYGDSDLPIVSGYVKIGKQVHTPWQVKLHYGKARVFVKSDAPQDLKLKLELK